MKKTKSLFLLSVASLLMLASCRETNGDVSSSEETPSSQAPSSSEPDTPSSSEEEFNTITIAKAIEIAKASGDTESAEQYIKGTITKISDASYGAMTLKDSTDSIYVYGCKGQDGTYFNKLADQPKVGDDIIILAKLKMFNNEPEVSSSKLIKVYHNNVPTTPDDDLEEITIAKALEIATASTTETKEYKMSGKVKEISSYQYGSMTLEDATGSIYVYGLHGANDEYFDKITDKPKVGDDIVIRGTLINYQGTPEVKVAKLISVTHNKQEIDLTQYEEATIAQAREKTKGSKVKITGVVARITYADGMVKNGFYVIDKTSSIYVHGNDVATQVQEGNTITIAGAIDFWILEKEQSAAAKFGYNGSCQLTSSIIVSNDEQKSEFDKSWIAETTVKKMMNTPVSENITNKIYKVNALIKKVEGANFVNYYINDIDGKTGTYTYTQTSGKDFKWLDEFNGKICTVYLTAMNAKSSQSGAFWRFIPVEVKDENYTFDTTKVGEYVYEYEVRDLFKDQYTGDPILEVPTAVSSELLGFQGATVSYSSDNTTNAYFETKEGKTIFHCAGEGKANITVTVNYGSNEAYSQTFAVKSVDLAAIETITVKEAIDSKAYAYDGTETREAVTVKGIAGPSLVSQVGFYLIDETGTIAVKTTEAVMGEIEMGQEIIIKGYRANYKPTSTFEGQICLIDSELVANLYGQHEIPTNTFKTGKTLTELYNTSVSEQHTAEVYTVTCKVVETSSTSGTYTNVQIKLNEGDTYMTLYSKSSGQYSHLLAFKDKEVTVNLALCNWNGKSYYTGCVLSATDGTTTVYTKLNYDNN